jgi:mono/diheme cytochrome c family protein
MNSNSRSYVHRATAVAGLLVCVAAVTACPPPPTPEPTPVDRGREIFFNETFEGNGRTCGTCHRAEDNFGLTPNFIATLPPDDPLFVAETNPNLAENFENPRLMRAFGLILENQDGFDDLANNFNMRGIPHTLAQRTSVDSRLGPQTGWSGDGAPGDGSLRAFSTGAVIQHFTLTTNRIAGVDFQLPNDQQLDDLEAFMLSLGRQADLELPLPLKGVVAARGQEIFLDNGLGKCNACHFNAGANGDPAIFGAGAGNLNFNTGVEDLPDQPADQTGELVPPDDGAGTPGNGEFNTPPLVEAADTPPFFHNNSVLPIEGAVAFYNGDAFNNSPAGQLVAGATGGGINLDGTQVEGVAAFLRVINALENVRASVELLDRAASTSRDEDFDNLVFANEETDDAIMVQRADRASRSSQIPEPRAGCDP